VVGTSDSSGGLVGEGRARSSVHIVGPRSTSVSSWRWSLKSRVEERKGGKEGQSKGEKEHEGKGREVREEGRVGRFERSEGEGGQ